MMGGDTLGLHPARAGITDPGYERARNAVVLGYKCRRRHLLADTNALGGDAYKNITHAEARLRYAAQKKGSEAREIVVRTRKKPKVAPRIEIVLNWQQENVVWSGTPHEFTAIGVLFPAHLAQQGAIVTTKRDQIAPAAVVRA